MSAAALPGCAGGGASSGTPPPPPPAASVTISPPSASVLLGKTAQFSAAVAGITNTQVVWSVNGVPGGNSSLGTIAAGGLYTGPADLPSPATLQIGATSVANAAASATAQVTVTSDVSVGIAAGSSSVELGARLGLSATVSSQGQPDPAVRWSLSGPACPAACGSVDASGTYTAPQILPAAPNVTVTAQSVADSSKQASVPVSITSHFTLQLTAPGTITPSASATLVATLMPVAGSNPSTVLTWSLAGTGCSNTACGILSAATTQAQGIGNLGGDTETANYTAPNSPPVPNTVVVTATPLADPSKRAQATIIVQPGTGLSLSPVSATLAINHRQTFAAQISGAASSSINWTVNGIPAGSSALGQICAVGSGPCISTATSSAAQVDYLAPGALPLPNPVTIQATSAGDANKFATAQVTILNHVLVSVLPGSVTLAAGASQPLNASVLGTANQGVTWQLQGAGCSVAGACGSISPAGLYTAPGIGPTPNSFQAIATSVDDPTQSGFAAITVTSGATLQTLHPASVYAGAALGFVLRVDGGGFVSTNPGPGSTLLIGGAARTTSCLSSTECTAAVFASDVATAGNLNIQMQNPDGSFSNRLPLIVAAPNLSDEVIALSGAAPVALGKDITVVEPTTAGVSVPGENVDLDIAALGIFSTGSNLCSLGGNPIMLARPASGFATFDLCAFSQAGLDTSMAYTVTGPGDVAVVAKQPAGLGIIHLTLQVSANAQSGARTLFIQNLNLDQTAASGVLEVQ